MDTTYTTKLISAVTLLVLGAGLFTLGLATAQVNQYHAGHHASGHHSHAPATNNESVSYDAHVASKDALMKKHMAEGDYACCLAKPCASCLELDPYHGEKAMCHCLEDIVNGEGPCDECAGGILAGRGNPYLVSYFSDAISAKYGEEHRVTIERIIKDAYEG